MCRSSSASVDQPGKVNMTAEEDVEDGDNIPDIRTIRVSAKEPHLYADPANGTADLSPVLSLSECLKIAVLNSFFLLEKQCQLCSVDEEVPPIKHGESITDRRSTFQPHLAPVVTPGQVKHTLLLFGWIHIGQHAIQLTGGTQKGAKYTAALSPAPPNDAEPS